MYGVVDGMYYTHLDRTEELSKRMYNRNIPSGSLQAQFSIRPVSSKYDLLPIFDRRPPATVTIKPAPTYNVQNIFNPGTAQAPWSGFSANINDESQLRNQFFALQNAGHSTYIPPTTSDMYQTNVYAGSTIQEQPFPFLFSTPALEPFNPNTHDIARSNFSNHTRQQIKMI